MQNAKGSDFPASPANTATAPSVPISLYREVATELHTTRMMMESLKLQNQQLNQQNQQLRIEIERVVQSALQLRQVADERHTRYPATPSDTDPSDLELHFEPSPALITPSRRQAPVDLSEPTDVPKPRFTAQQEPKLRRQGKADRQTELGGWWLGLVIFFIVLTAFGAGFLIVKSVAK